VKNKSKPPQRFDQLYQALPFVYIGAGLLVMLLLQNMMAVVSGVLLIAVGTLEVMRRRRDGREREAAETRHASRLHADREGPQTQALMQIAWRKSYECGHPVIDAEHRRLFEIGDTVINAVMKNKTRAHIEFLLDELTEHIQAHFSTEEAVLARTRYPLTQEHRGHHMELLQKAQGLRDSYRQGLLDVSELVGFIAYDVITEHIINEDLKFALKDRQPAAA
jgi:hemerythrin-like metal-binding protein